MNIKPIIAALTLGAMVTGCAGIPAPDDRQALTYEKQKSIDGWNEAPDIRFSPRNRKIEVSESSEIPRSILNKKIHTHTSGQITTQDLVFILDQSGIQAAVGSQDVEGMSLYLPKFTGSVGSLLQMLSDTSNLAFRYVGQTIVIDDSKQYIVKIEQQKDLSEIISSAVQSLGATDVYASTEAGTVTYNASTRKQRAIEDYLERLSVNSSLINMQLAVITVRLSDERNSGFDWSSFTAKFGASNLVDNQDQGLLGNLTSAGMGLTFAGDTINIASALNLLSTYGESKTVQNLTLQTLSGVPVSLKSGDEIPYISDIPTVVSDNTTTSGLNTKTIETGFQVDLDALYDSDEQMVTVNMDLALRSLVGFRDLSAGAQLGTITQPQTQQQELNNIIKLKAGETALLGGLVIENYSDNRQNLSAIDRLPIGSQSTDSNRTAVFIMLRPTVTVFSGGKS